MTSPSRAPLDRAFALLDQGELEGALSLLDDALATSQRAHGERSLPAARAHNDKGTLLRAIGDDEGALASFQRAVDLTADNDDSRREHLTYLLNVGDVLQRSGVLEDAEDAIRRSLYGRRELYGPSHPGYAFALEPLAQVLLRQAKLDLALEAIEEAVASFRHHAHPRLATAMAVRAETLAAAGADTRTLEGIESLPDELLPALAEALQSRLADGDPRMLARVLYELLPALEARLGAAHEVTIATWSAIANVEAHGGDPVRRREAILHVRRTLDTSGDGFGALEASLALALAYLDEGDEERARESYEDAKRRALATENDAAIAHALRSYGVYLDHIGATDEAISALGEATKAAVRSGDPQLEGRCHAALGVIFAHTGNPAAQSVLSLVAVLLPRDHGDALVARAHREALEEGRACGCGDVDVALSQALREMVKARLPRGLIDDIAVVSDADEELSLDVRLLREPSPREQVLLDEVVRAAHRKLRERVLREG